MNPHSERQQANQKIPYSTRIQESPPNPRGGDRKAGFFKIRRDDELEENDEEQAGDKELNSENEEDEDEEEEDEQEI